MPKVILIAGPTASGKSGLALELARKFKGEVINADSMQVYDQLRIITARPSAQEMGNIPHHLYGHVGIDEPYSVGRWCREAEVCVRDILSRGRVAIIAGGTGLYFKALVEGLAEIPDVRPDIADEVRQLLSRQGAAGLYKALAEEDAAMAARLEQGDTQRLTRALEVVRSTGRSLAAWQRAQTVPILSRVGLHDGLVPLVLMPPRDWLYARCDRRFDLMLEAGALEEVRAAASYSTALSAMKALGVPQLMRHLSGELSLEEASASAKQETRRYAKRQYTWFRNQFPDWFAIDEKDSERVLRIACNYITKMGLTA